MPKFEYNFQYMPNFAKFDYEMPYWGDTFTRTKTYTSTTPKKDNIEENNSQELSSKDNNKYNKLILKYAKKYDVEPNLIKAMIKQESQFNPKAKSKAGAEGLMQLMPATAKDLGVNNSFDPEQNIKGGVKYIAEMLKRYNGDVKLALAAYNAGPGNVKDKIPENGETPGYVKNVMKYYNEYNLA